MPRIINESQLLQANVQLLQTQLEEAHKEMAARQAERGNCMAELERLKNLQKELQAVKESLLQSDDWGNLLVEVENAFERNELQTNESLSSLQKMILSNLAVFADVNNDSRILENYVEKNGYVFVRDRPAITHALYLDYRYRRTKDNANEKIHCPFAQAKEPFLKKKRAFAYPMGSNLSQLFDREFLNLVESGIIKHLSSIDLPNAEICPQDLGGTERQLRNGDLMMTYYIMLAGFATSIAVFTTEILFRLLNGRRESNKWARHGIGRTPNGRSVVPSRWMRLRRTDSDSDKQHLVGSYGSNTTPPPPYQSIFSSQGGGRFGEGSRHLHKNMAGRWLGAKHGQGLAGESAAETGGGVLMGRGIVGAAIGGALGGLAGRVGRHDPFGDESNSVQDSNGSRRFINGRDYMVFRNSNGQSQLMPMRNPSAALFQYSYTE